MGLWGVKFAEKSFYGAGDHHKFIKCFIFFVCFVILSNLLTKQREMNEIKYERERERRRDKNTRT